MKSSCQSKFLAISAGATFLSVATRAAEHIPTVQMHERGIPEALGMMVLFAIVGVLSAVAGYRIFDKFTPGDLHNEIVEKKNMAAAVIAGAAILGVCIIVAAAMIG